MRSASERGPGCRCSGRSPGVLSPPWGHPQPWGRWQEVAGTGQAPTRASVGEVHGHRAPCVPAGVPGVPPDLPAAHGALNGPQIASPCRIYGTADPITQRGTPCSGGRGERGASHFQPCFTGWAGRGTNTPQMPSTSPRCPPATHGAPVLPPAPSPGTSRAAQGQVRLFTQHTETRHMQPAGCRLGDKRLSSPPSPPSPPSLHTS